MIDLAWGRGSLIVDGGVISVLVILGIAIGGMVAIEAWATLNIMGFGALIGHHRQAGRTYERWRRCAGIAFAAQCGCRMTAEIGSMRIAEEIDATEAMGLRPIPFVVGTRLVGGDVMRDSRVCADVADQLLRLQLLDLRCLSRGGGNISTLSSSSSCHLGSFLFDIESCCLCCGGDNNSLLLRVFRVGRASRCRPGVGACGTGESGGGHDAGLRA